MVRRLIIMIPQLIALSIIIFILAEFMPGDALSGEIDPNVSPERLEELRQMFGFYDPWYVKYTRWIGNIIRGDFGRSIAHQMPVTQIIGQRIGNTFRLSLFSVVLVYLISIPLGILSGRFSGRALDKGILFYTFVMFAMPVVVLALLAIWIFSLRLGWFPFSGSVDVLITRATNPIAWHMSRLHHLILPSIVSALMTIGIIQFLRMGIIDNKNSDYAITARSKGVPEGKVFSRHVLRNSIIPIVSGIGFTIVGLLGGGVLIERTFNYPGMGSLFMDAIMRRDYSVVNTLVLFYGALSVIGGLLSDIGLTIADPRIRIK